MPKQRLTKTNYLQYLACPEELWMQMNLDLPSSISSDALFKIEQGKLIDKLAHRLFIEGCTVQNITIDQKNVRFQEGAEVGDYQVRADITVVDPESGRSNLFEVKATTAVKKEHIHDVAFQQMVFQNSGTEIDKCYLVHINKEYITNGSLDLCDYFNIQEITKEVQAIKEETAIRAQEALTFINGPEPKKRITFGCENKLKCPFVQQHFTDLPEYSVYDISRIHSKKLKLLIDAEQLNIMDVPTDFPLSDKQRVQVDIAQQNIVNINKEDIKSILDGLEWPLYFLDYETYSYVIPPQPRHKPYQQMLFQYSLHVLESPDAELQHFEYLLREQTEPVENIVMSLREHIKAEEGTVIVWNKAFETGRNKELANIFPKHADFLLSLNSRVYDLMEIFSKGLYLHPDFKGSASIKNVLPVLCPELSYGDLVIQNGMEAVIQWHNMTTGEFRGDHQELVYQALLKYCELDTFAMVRIWEELKNQLS